MFKLLYLDQLELANRSHLKNKKMKKNGNEGENTKNIKIKIK